MAVKAAARAVLLHQADHFRRRGARVYGRVVQKNQLLTLRIERLSSDGSGVAHSPEGEAVFVPGTAPGDEAQVRIVKDCGRYAFGILDKLLTPSPDRIPVDCAVAGP